VALRRREERRLDVTGSRDGRLARSENNRGRREQDGKHETCECRGDRGGQA
jgi:hypothetical protein